MPPRKNFPITKAIGRGYSSQQYGYGLEGVVTDVVERGDNIVFFEGDKEAFSFNQEWGSWWEEKDVIWVSIPYIGTYSLCELVQ